MKRVHTRLGLAFAVLLAIGCGTRTGQQAKPATVRGAAHETVTLRSATLEQPVRTAFVGEGSLEVRSEKVGKSRLWLQKLAIEAQSTGDVVEMTIDHVFENRSDEQLEGTFRFPLPEGAMLVGLAMEIEDKLMEGELVESEKARKVYEQILDEMRDPALLEWESGQTFKLRVFPIEAKKSKRVVLRLVAPLHRSDAGLFFAYRAPAGDGALSPERVTLTIDKRPVSFGVAASGGAVRAPTGEMLVKIADEAHDAYVEQTKSGRYYVAHVAPSFDGPAPRPDKPQAMIVLCDRSRSMLEARALEAKTVGLLVDELGPSDRFTVITGDVRARSLPGGLRPPADKAAATAFVDATEPDGASDLGALLAAAGQAGDEARAKGFEPVFVYLGDATATWGETRSPELESIARRSLGGAPLHVLVLGKSPDDASARGLAAATHGRLLRPKTEDDARRAAQKIARARTARRIEDVRLEAPEGLEVASELPGTIYEGDDVTVTAFRPASKDERPGEAAPELRLTGSLSGKAVAQKIGFASALPARDVARRWAKARIEKLEREGDAKKEEIVKTSLEHGVMSRYTSFLVLESEEAYARFQIARKAKHDANGDARVTGRDLDGDGRGASVSPDHLQPGDPEVRIPAPADAQSVVVVFPFGETKTATYEDDGRGGAWVVRFLVDAHTPDGTYEIVVRITHRDGHVEIQKLAYVVDTQKPNLDVSIRARSDGRYEISAKQRLSAEEIAAQAPSAEGSLEERRRRYAHVLTDAKRAEVRTPDGQTIALTHVRLGEFVGTWTPTEPVARGAKLRVVAVDRALNENAIDVVIP
jgi:hypothetical protein